MKNLIVVQTTVFLLLLSVQVAPANGECKDESPLCVFVKGLGCKEPLSLNCKESCNLCPAINGGTSSSVAASISATSSMAPVSSITPASSVAPVSSINPTSSIVPASSMAPGSSVVPASSISPTSSMIAASSMTPSVAQSSIVPSPSSSVATVSSTAVTLAPPTAPPTTTEFTLPPTPPGSDSTTLVAVDLTSTTSSVHTSTGFASVTGFTGKRRRRSASNPVDFLRLVANTNGKIDLNTFPRNLIEESNKCKCVGNFGDIDWTFRCNDQVFCLSFFVRRTSSVTGITTTSVNQTFKHYRGVTKAYTSSDLENGKWVRITQNVNGKCDQVSGSLAVTTSATDTFDVASFALHGKKCADVVFI